MGYKGGLDYFGEDLDLVATDPDLLAAEEVSELLGISLHSVYEGAARGEIPCRRVGRRVLFSRRRIAEWLHGEAILDSLNVVASAVE